VTKKKKTKKKRRRATKLERDAAVRLGISSPTLDLHPGGTSLDWQGRKVWLRLDERVRLREK